MVFENVLEAMGETPMIRLNKMGDPDGAQILVKYEGLNVGGANGFLTAARGQSHGNGSRQPQHAR